jgi:hypothetical protein
MASHDVVAAKLARASICSPITFSVAVSGSGGGMIAVFGALERRKRGVGVRRPKKG